VTATEEELAGSPAYRFRHTRPLPQLISSGSVVYEPEFLRHDKSVVADRETGITQSLAHLGRVPELLVAGPPLRDRQIVGGHGEKPTDPRRLRFADRARQGAGHRR
jgi:hypothetical protein